MALMNIFDIFDADDSGTMSQAEFSQYSLHTGDGPATDDVWSVVKGNFDMRDGELTLKGFVQLHEMEVEDGGGDTEDTWLSLHAAGYNDALQLDQAAPFAVDVFSEEGRAELDMKAVERLVGTAEWAAFAQFVLDKGTPEPKAPPGLDLRSFKTTAWAIITLAPVLTSSISPGDVELCVEDANSEWREVTPSLNSIRIIWVLPKKLQDLWNYSVSTNS